MLGLDQESMLKELWKHDKHDPEHGQNDVDDGWTEICKNLKKKCLLSLKNYEWH